MSFTKSLLHSVYNNTDNSYLFSLDLKCTPLIQMEKESNPSKNSWKIVFNRFNKSNYYILRVNTNTKQLYFHLQKVLTDKRLCHMRTPHRQTFLQIPSKQISYIHSSRHFHFYTSGLQTIYFSYRQAIKQMQKIL